MSKRNAERNEQTVSKKPKVEENPTDFIEEVDELFFLMVQSDYLQGFQLMYGMGKGRDQLKGVEWFEKAARNDHALAKVHLARALALGESIKEDREKAEQLGSEAYGEITVKAGQGDADAQLCLGELLFEGLGISEDKQQAIEWFEKAAKQGNAVAQNNLGFVFSYGIGARKIPYYL